jgi:arylsulfatase A-like enzyme
VLFLKNPAGVDPATRRRMLDSLERLNSKQYEQFADPETQARIAQYEMAFRMQTSVPELTDISDEPKHVLDMYGPDVHKPGTFARSALLARRMAERGVRFTQIFHRGWDQHFNVGGDLPNQCRDIDQPSQALVKDLKQRGMLDDTLVVWGGEFGRTVYSQGKLTRNNYGRDHHPGCFTVWLAGGGIKRGTVYGETDDFSYNITKNRTHINDLNATILHCLGINHKKLSIKFQGLDARLTGVEDHGKIDGILA